MIAGRLHWKKPQTCPGKIGSRRTFPPARSRLTEAGSNAARPLYLVRESRTRQAQSRRTGSARCRYREFKNALRENHTSNAALTDPPLSGIGNAYSDRILHRAGCRRSARRELADDDRTALQPRFRRRLITGSNVCDTKPATASRERDRVSRDFAVHGRFGKPCPAVRRQGAAHYLRGERDELLPRAKRRKGAGGSLDVAIVERRLAEVD